MIIKTKRDVQWVTMLIRKFPYAENIPELKRELRSFLHRKSDRRIFNAEYDDWIELIKCPSWVKNDDDAREWFEENERKVCPPSQYDCTGYAFTLWYKFVKRNDGYYCYHRICLDV